MNCCSIIILLLLLGNCNSSCKSNYIEPRRNARNECKNVCNNDCSDSVNDCTRTQTVITRTECDTNTCNNMAADTYVGNRYSMYNMDNDDCGCRN